MKLVRCMCPVVAGRSLFIFEKRFESIKHGAFITAARPRQTCLTGVTAVWSRHGPPVRKSWHFPATARNRDAIAAVLTRVLPDRGTVLEIGSGSGEHAHHFSELFPHLTWQPSDPDQLNLDGILAWVDAAGRPIFARLSINASDVILPLDSADAVVCVNVIHISRGTYRRPNAKRGARVLPPEGLLYLRSLPDCRLPRHRTNHSTDHYASGTKPGGCATSKTSSRKP